MGSPGRKRGGLLRKDGEGLKQRNPRVRVLQLRRLPAEEVPAVLPRGHAPVPLKGKN